MLRDYEGGAAEGVIVRVLSMWEPWATLAATPRGRDEAGKPLGAWKEWETRAWHPTRYHVNVPFTAVIHATKRPVPRELIKTWPFNLALPSLSFAPGRLLALVRVAEVVTVEQFTTMHSGPAFRAPDAYDRVRQEWAFGDYSPGRYAWRMENLRPLRMRPPWKGIQQPLPILPHTIASQVLELAEPATYLLERVMAVTP